MQSEFLCLANAARRRERHFDNPAVMTNARTGTGTTDRRCAALEKMAGCRGSLPVLRRVRGATLHFASE